MNHHNTKRQLFLKYFKINQIILIELIIFSRLKDVCIICFIKKSVDSLEVALVWVQRIRLWKFIVKRCGNPSWNEHLICHNFTANNKLLSTFTNLFSLTSALCNVASKTLTLSSSHSMSCPLSLIQYCLLDHILNCIWTWTRAVVLESGLGFLYLCEYSHF